MADPERQAAEQQLTAILNRALKHVPLVKLDAVDDVMKLFTEAVELMESSLELDDDDEGRAASAASTPTNAQGGGGAAGSGGAQGTASAGQSKLLSLATGISSTATTAQNSSAGSSANSSDSESEARGTIPPLQNKAITGVAMTVDYSSPSSKTRSLGKGPKASAGAGAEVPSSRAQGGGSTSLGIGLGGGKSTGNAAKPGVLGLHGAHKPSSRATASQSALGSSVSPVSPTTPDSSDSSSETAAADAPAGLQAKNKLVAKIGAAASQREFPSPKLGPRSLSMAPARPAGSATPTASTSSTPTPSASAPPPNAAAAGLSLPMADSLGREQPVSLPSQQSGLASPDADDEGPEDESETGDLIRTDKKNNVFNRVKSTLPVTASPKQIRSSFHLLELATTHSLLQADQEEDLTMKTQGGGGAAPASANAANGPSGVSSGGVLSSLPTGITSAGTGTTPKPAFLRRLDSPETHHGQLIAAKARLQMLINRGLQVADKVRLEKVPEIKASLERALAKLEASLVTTTITNQ